jgi:hypothetical protein
MIYTKRKGGERLKDPHREKIRDRHRMKAWQAGSKRDRQKNKRNRQKAGETDRK